MFPSVARIVLCHRLTQPGTGAVGAGEAVVGVDPVRLHAERGQGVALGSEILGVGGAAGVPGSSWHCSFMW
jgi:hypothetical protein